MHHRMQRGYIEYAHMCTVTMDIMRVHVSADMATKLGITVNRCGQLWPPPRQSADAFMTVWATSADDAFTSRATPC